MKKDRIDDILEYVQRTNKEMTREKLISELSACDYATRSVILLVRENANLRTFRESERK